MGVVKLSTAEITQYQKYSNFLAGNPAFTPSAYVLLESVITTSDVATAIFSDLVTKYGSTYKHFQIRMTGRGTASEQLRDFIIRFNGDSGTNYSLHSLIGYSDGTQKNESNGGGNTTYGIAGSFPAGLAATNVFGASVVDILDPFTTKNKTTRSLTGFMSSSGAFLNLVGLQSSAWRNTNSITSITIQPITANIAQGSRFSLYGIRG